MHGTLASHTVLHTTPFTPWQPGDNPEDHPLWEEQVELELDMVQRGADRYRERVAKARAKGEMSGTRIYHRKIEEMVPRMVKHLKDYLAKMARYKGTKVAYQPLLSIDPGVACFIALRTLLDGITPTPGTDADVGGMYFMAMAARIGMEVEYQARMDAWASNAPDLFYGVQHSISKHATSRHIKRVNINRFNALMKEKLNWAPWSKELKFHVGSRLIEIAVQSTGMFEVTDDRIFDAQGHCFKQRGGITRAKDLKSAPYIIRLLDHALEDLVRSMDADETRYPQYMPTLIPPKRWDGIFDGGYYTPVIRKPTLVRFHAESDDVRQAALEEYDAIDMPRVMSALHYVQEVPWMINRKVLTVALQMWDRDLAMAGFPKRDIIPMPVRPAGFDEASALAKTYEHRLNKKVEDKKTGKLRVMTGKERKAEFLSWPQAVQDAWTLVRTWRQAAAKVYSENARRVSKARSVTDTLMIADKFLHREFYFPHMLDFRGRMYPIPIYLQPQGNDLARGLLTFAKGQRIGEEGAEWLAIHLAGHFGADKLTYEARVQWVKDNEEVWRAIARDPIGSHHLWLDETGIKHHWQGLAAVFEWVRYLEEGPDMISALPVHIDGTCNGIQHLSAMMLDEVGGAAVNLVPDFQPHDIYADVAAKLQDRLKGIRRAGGAQGAKARLWLEACGGTIPRSLTKRPVMTTPYGATREAHFGSLYDWLKENCEDKGILPFGSTEADNEAAKRKLVPWLVTHLEDALRDIVARAKECMGWLQKVAKAVAETNQPVVWKTPSGFVVRHFYGKEEGRKLETKIDNKRITVKYFKRTSQLSKREQLQGIPPNFTHSMDASANTETIIRLALDSTRPPVTAIHDAYGTVAGAMWKLYAAVRTAFVWVHSDDVLLDYRNVCVAMLRDHFMATRPELEYTDAWQLADESIARLPKRGTLDVSAVANSEYFFA